LNFYAQNLNNRWLGEKYLRHYDEITRRLEIDGYLFKEGQLYQVESDILSVEEEISFSETLHKLLGLSDQTNIFQFFNLSEKH